MRPEAVEREAAPEEEEEAEHVFNPNGELPPDDRLRGQSMAAPAEPAVPGPREPRYPPRAIFRDVHNWTLLLLPKAKSCTVYQVPKQSIARSTVMPRFAVSLTPHAGAKKKPP